MTHTYLLRTLAILITLCVGIVFGMPAPSALADGLQPVASPTMMRHAPPGQNPNPPPTPPAGGGDPIKQIIHQIIQFPFENLVEALQNALKSNKSTGPIHLP